MSINTFIQNGVIGIDISDLTPNGQKELIEKTSFKDQDLDMLMQAINEIYSTPEGKKLIEDTAKLSVTGKVHFLYSEDAHSQALHNGIVPPTVILSTEDTNKNYPIESSDETNEFAPFSIQRSIFHELYHIQQQHNDTLSDEHDTITATNEFMSKYYNEPQRALRYYEFKESGEKGFKINPHFKCSDQEQPTCPIWEDLNKTKDANGTNTQPETTPQDNIEEKVQITSSSHQTVSPS